MYRLREKCANVWEYVIEKMRMVTIDFYIAMLQSLSEESEIYTTDRRTMDRFLRDMEQLNKEINYHKDELNQAMDHFVSKLITLGRGDREPSDSPVLRESDIVKLSSPMLRISDHQTQLNALIERSERLGRRVIELLQSLEVDRNRIGNELSEMERLHHENQSQLNAMIERLQQWRGTGRRRYSRRTTESSRTRQRMTMEAVRGLFPRDTDSSPLDDDRDEEIEYIFQDIDPVFLVPRSHSTMEVFDIGSGGGGGGVTSSIGVAPSGLYGIDPDVTTHRSRSYSRVETSTLPARIRSIQRLFPRHYQTNSQQQLHSRRRYSYLMEQVFDDAHTDSQLRHHSQPAYSLDSMTRHSASMTPVMPRITTSQASVRTGSAPGTHNVRCQVSVGKLNVQTQIGVAKRNSSSQADLVIESQTMPTLVSERLTVSSLRRPLVQDAITQIGVCTHDTKAQTIEAWPSDLSGRSLSEACPRCKAEPIVHTAYSKGQKMARAMSQPAQAVKVHKKLQVLMIEPAKDAQTQVGLVSRDFTAKVDFPGMGSLPRRSLEDSAMYVPMKTEAVTTKSAEHQSQMVQTLSQRTMVTSSQTRTDLRILSPDNLRDMAVQIVPATATALVDSAVELVIPTTKSKRSVEQMIQVDLRSPELIKGEDRHGKKLQVNIQPVTINRQTQWYQEEVRFNVFSQTKSANIATVTAQVEHKLPQTDMGTSTKASQVEAELLLSAQLIVDDVIQACKSTCDKVTQSASPPRDFASCQTLVIHTEESCCQQVTNLALATIQTDTVTQPAQITWASQTE
ncbi:unnamed protein product, partial [Protopolystoma xenopodis]